MVHKYNVVLKCYILVGAKTSVCASEHYMSKFNDMSCIFQICFQVS